MGKDNSDSEIINSLEKNIHTLVIMINSLEKDKNHFISKIKFIRNIHILVIMILTILVNIYIITLFENVSMTMAIIMNVNLFILDLFVLYVIYRMHCYAREVILECQENYEKCINSLGDTGKD